MHRKIQRGRGTGGTFSPWQLRSSRSVCERRWNREFYFLQNGTQIAFTCANHPGNHNNTATSDRGKPTFTEIEHARVSSPNRSRNAPPSSLGNVSPGEKNSIKRENSSSSHTQEKQITRQPPPPSHRPRAHSPHYLKLQIQALEVRHAQSGHFSLVQYPHKRYRSGRPGAPSTRAPPPAAASQVAVETAVRRLKHDRHAGPAPHVIHLCRVLG